jgi:hypothetical protein
MIYKIQKNRNIRYELFLLTTSFEVPIKTTWSSQNSVANQKSLIKRFGKKEMTKLK